MWHLYALSIITFSGSEVMVAFAQDKINQYGRVTDQKTLDLIMQMIENIVVWTRRLAIAGIKRILIANRLFCARSQQVKCSLPIVWLSEYRRRIVFLHTC